MSQKPENTSDTKPKDVTQTDAQGSASVAEGRTPGAADVQGSASVPHRDVPMPEAADAAREKTKAAPPSTSSAPPGKQPVQEDVSAAGGGALAAAEAHELEVAPEVKQLRVEIEVARAEAAENLDKFLRAKAETENVRRRAETEVANARKYGVERFAAELLAVKDSLELARAMELKEDDTAAVQKMHEGLDLTLKLMDDVFRKFGLTAVDPKGEKFDPERHQAISVVESDLVAPNHVVTVVQKGYLLHERVLRPAMVTVSKEGVAPEHSAENT
ncbi:MAG: hypothetical protein BMS9Abin22_397 [Gammaproteobacteria bacterium]|nr:MAG: hypothetical protein BMS9Abin22_397 [Gammaproteobacteria bacterium]